MRVAGDVKASEADVKAAFLYNFARLITWPAGAWESAQAPFVVAVLGADPLGTALDASFSGKSLDGRAFELRRYADVAALKPCHILFVPEEQQAGLPAVLKALGRNVLVVGEGESFTRDGGAVRFYRESTTGGTKVRFEINVDVARRAGLEVSSKLLALARVVHDQQGAP